MTCPVASSIAVHCNQEPHDVCYGCEHVFTEDCNHTEIITKRNGFQFVCDNCVDDFTDKIAS